MIVNFFFWVRIGCSHGWLWLETHVLCSLQPKRTCGLFSGSGRGRGNVATPNVWFRLTHHQERQQRRDVRGTIPSIWCW
uniref:Putative secreted protein n=1 Tax=Anopheles darlingi TaxID=43151 RepID=A0A2M4DB83_ANODA